MDAREVVKSQYHAALTALRYSFERCPESLWLSGDYVNPTWHIAYHTIYYTHLYLMPAEADFRPWENHRAEYQFLGNLPWPPHRPAAIGEPYTKDEVVRYWEFVRDLVDPTVDRLDLASEDSGFWWVEVGKLEMQLYNLRHIQHHTGQLADRMRNVADLPVRWVTAG